MQILKPSNLERYFLQLPCLAMFLISVFYIPTMRSRPCTLLLSLTKELTRLFCSLNNILWKHKILRACKFKMRLELNPFLMYLKNHKIINLKFFLYSVQFIVFWSLRINNLIDFIAMKFLVRVTLSQQLLNFYISTVCGF